LIKPFWYQVRRAGRAVDCEPLAARIESARALRSFGDYSSKVGKGISIWPVMIESQIAVSEDLA
jgi:hypothetical protein